MSNCNEQIEIMYQAAINALAHIDCECESIIPKNCDCDTRKRYVEAIALLNKTKEELNVKHTG